MNLKLEVDQEAKERERDRGIADAKMCRTLEMKREKSVITASRRAHVPGNPLANRDVNVRSVSTRWPWHSEILRIFQQYVFQNTCKGIAAGTEKNTARRKYMGTATDEEQRVSKMLMKPGRKNEARRKKSACMSPSVS